MNQENKMKQIYMEIAKGRKSIHSYDENVKISRQELEEMLEIAVSAPSSTNLQPWRFAVIDSPEAKQELIPFVGFNSNQVITSSATIAVFGDLDNVEYLNEIYSKTVELGTMTEEVKKYQVEQISAGYQSITRDQIKEIVLTDCGLVSMHIMLTAKAFGYDTNPIGGYDRDNLGEVLGFAKERYIPIMLITIGKSAEAGKYSYRLPISTVAKFQ